MLLNTILLLVKDQQMSSHCWDKWCILTIDSEKTYSILLDQKIHFNFLSVTKALEMADAQRPVCTGLLVSRLSKSVLNPLCWFSFPWTYCFGFMWFFCTMSTMARSHLIWPFSPVSTEACILWPRAKRYSEGDAGQVSQRFSFGFHSSIRCYCHDSSLAWLGITTAYFLVPILRICSPKQLVCYQCNWVP